MSKDIKTSREIMVDGAVALIEERGAEYLSARGVAERLGISTQPIYREFGDMDGLRAAAAERGWRVYAEYVRGGAVEQAIRYVMFACERKKLFNFLFRGNNCVYGGLDDMAHRLVDGTDIIERLQELSGLDREQVVYLHLYLWMALHGLASMSADNDVKLSGEEIERFVKELTRALTAHIKCEKGG